MDFPDVQIVLELTEGTLIDDDGVTVGALHDLKAAGTRLAVDDFGVGYSSVGYLHRLPVDILKIDKSFVHQLGDPRAYALVQGVVSMARSMQLTVVVEASRPGRTRSRSGTSAAGSRRVTCSAVRCRPRR